MSPLRWRPGDRVRVRYIGRNGRPIERAGVVEALYFTPADQIVEIAHVDGTKVLYAPDCLSPWYGGAEPRPRLSR